MPRLDTTTQFITVVIICLTLLSLVQGALVARRRKDAFPLRPIAAYASIPTMVGTAIEAGRPVHISVANTGLGGSNTLLTLASAELFYQTAVRAEPTILTANDPLVLPLSYVLLQRAYARRGHADRFSGRYLRWYPAPAQPLAFAGALTTTLSADQVSGSILLGNFGSELALVLDAANRRKQGSIASSVDLTGQAVAYALAGDTLIGEEMFVAGAYLGDNTAQRGAVVALDTLRWLLIGAIVVYTFVSLYEPVRTALLGGG